MKILVDENIPKRTVAELRGKGHDVLDIRGTPKQGIDDTELWRIAQKEKRMLITTDKWFRKNRNQDHQGILIVLLREPNRRKIHEKIIKSIHQFSERQWTTITVIVKDKVHSVLKKISD